MEKVTIIEYEIVPKKVLIKLETTVDGYKRLCQYKLEQIQEIRYRGGNFYLIYGPDNAESFIEATWPHDKIEFELPFLQISLNNLQNRYLRGNRLTGLLRLEEITDDGKLIVKIL